MQVIRFNTETETLDNHRGFGSCFYRMIMKLLDEIKKRYEIKTDAELSRVLKVPPPTISKIRSYRVNVSAEIILRIHETLDMPVADIRKLL